MEANSMGSLITALREQLGVNGQSIEDESRLVGCARLFEEFNKSNEMRFRFTQDGGNNINSNDEFFVCLNSSWSYLTSQLEPRDKTQSHARLIAACLSSIRIVSRDSEAIKIFDSSRLLEIIQTIANLTCSDDKTM